MEERYVAFISYSHRDSRVARYLHRAIETYRFPKSVIGSESVFGPVPRKLPPVFRDRDELPASGDLGSELKAALAASRFQVVVCSPAAANSHWVNEEIKIFKRLSGERRTLAVIASGEPYADDEHECFPPALKFKLGDDGEISGDPAEPIAADLRREGDGRRLATMKLLAGLSGVRLDALTQRDNARRQRRMMAYMATSTTIAFVTMGLAIYAEGQRRTAVAERDLAESSLDFLTGTFEIANPATENPRTITAITILDRASERAADEFRERPEVAARLLRTTGDIYLNLGLFEESERDLLHALTLEPGGGAERARTLLRLAAIARRRGDVGQLEHLVNRAAQSYQAGEPNSELVDTMIQDQRGNIAFLKADYREAARRYAATVNGYEQLDGDYRAQIGKSLMDQAYALVQAREFEEADELYARAFDIFRKRFGMRDVRTGRALQSQAFASLSAGKADEAVPKMEAALSIYTRVHEPRHPDLAAARLLMGRIYAAQGETDLAADNLTEARNIFAAIYGSDNPAVADTNFYFAEALSEGGRTREALALTEAVKRIYDAAYGPNDPDQAELLLLRSRIHQRSGNLASAVADCRRALLLQRRIAAEPSIIAGTAESCAALGESRDRLVMNR
ncbi:tetratricopeptide repeat protein [Qipengyuania atrilutea]|uniref:Toll/interleukin-1 receptor domain-containing protein n=1 Tax=Qipengyuania atrilutea TaxID=2744473 RepID=A0A850H407_9SPHN|nr:tetratricopeptide repeat protein [Actirhodobacter atriluteus]NVD45376.1 toll/interleukin-1 receptor domain-containing protein [Actirhodobacter atriluteus]